MDPSLLDQVDRIVTGLVSDWNDGTKDNYLHKFEVFVFWLKQRDIRILDKVSQSVLL